MRLGLNKKKTYHDVLVGSCGTPPDIERGYWRKCGQDVTYKCNAWSVMNGSSEIRCENGRFTPNPPSCSCKQLCNILLTRNY